MWTLLLPNWPGLSLFTHHCLAGCCAAAPPCVNTAAAPLNRNATANASGTCKRLMRPLLWLGVQTLPQEPPAGQTDSCRGEAFNGAASCDGWAVRSMDLPATDASDSVRATPS